VFGMIDVVQLRSVLLEDLVEVVDEFCGDFRVLRIEIRHVAALKGRASKLRLNTVHSQSLLVPGKGTSVLAKSPTALFLSIRVAQSLRLNARFSSKEPDPASLPRFYAEERRVGQMGEKLF